MEEQSSLRCSFLPFLPPVQPPNPPFSQSPMPDRRWTQLATKTLIERWWMTLREDRVQLPSGHVIEEFHVTDVPRLVCRYCNH